MLPPLLQPARLTVARIRDGGWCVLCLCALCGIVRADELEYRITGVDEEILANVRSHVEQFGITGGSRITPGQFEQTIEDATERARNALKPFGYYHPNIAANLVEAGRGRWRLNMRIERRATGGCFLVRRFAAKGPARVPVLTCLAA